MSEEIEKKAQPQVITVMTDGERVLFDAEDYHDFETLEKNIERHFKFIRLGPNCLARTDMIKAFYYFPEGYNVGA